MKTVGDTTPFSANFSHVAATLRIRFTFPIGPDSEGQAFNQNPVVRSR